VKEEFQLKARWLRTEVAGTPWCGANVRAGVRQRAVMCGLVVNDLLVVDVVLYGLLVSLIFSKFDISTHSIVVVSMRCRKPDIA